jgi:biopolymer transport protein ExbD
MSPQTLRERAEVRLGPEEGPEFQIAPMIDILLVLLVFFMSISSTEVLQRTNNVVLPAAQNARIAGEPTGQTVMNVTWSTITNTGAIEMDGQTFAQPGELWDLLRLKAQHNPTLRVLIRADRSVRYDYLRPLMTAIGGAGVGKVTFSVVDRNIP